MAGLGWQEVVILLAIVVMWLVPVVVIWKTSARDRGHASAGWVLFAFIVFWFAWIVVGLYFLFGRRGIRQPVGQERQ